MCNVLPKQSTGLFRRKGSIKTTCCLWGKTLTFLRQTPFVSPTHTPLALFTFNCASARRVAVLRTEYPHFVRRFRLAATRAPPLTCKGDASPLTPD